MIEINSLKKDWQNQKPAAESKIDIKKTAGNALSKLKKFEKKQLRINLAKTSVVAMIFLFLIWSMLFETGVSTVKIIAVAWLVISAVVFLTIYWRTQLKVNTLNANENSLDFIDKVLENFSEQKRLFGEKFWIFGIALIIGINLLYLDVLKDFQLYLRLALHVSVSLILVAAVSGGIKFRMLRFKKEYDPLINELTGIKEDLRAQNGNKKG